MAFIASPRSVRDLIEMRAATSNHHGLAHTHTHTRARRHKYVFGNHKYVDDKTLRNGDTREWEAKKKIHVTMPVSDTRIPAACLTLFAQPIPEGNDSNLQRTPFVIKIRNTKTNTASLSLSLSLSLDFRFRSLSIRDGKMSLWFMRRDRWVMMGARSFDGPRSPTSSIASTSG
jgi:hypothetical protein